MKQRARMVVRFRSANNGRTFKVANVSERPLLLYFGRTHEFTSFVFPSHHADSAVFSGSRQRLEHHTRIGMLTSANGSSVNSTHHIENLPIHPATCTPPAMPSNRVKIKKPQKIRRCFFLVTPSRINAL